MTLPRDPIAAVEDAAPPDWDTRTIDPPGGHVLQGTAWAAHRASLGWTPHFVTFASGRAALVLSHRQPPLPGFTAYAPRGPVAGGDPAEAVAGRAAALAGWMRERGGTILAVDPELDADPAFERAMAAAGFAPTEEIQPSRHRLVLRFEPGDDPEAVLARVSKATRQRIRAAEAGGIDVVEDPAGQHLDAFGELIGAVADRKHFTFSPEQGFVRWWRRVLATPAGRFWVAQHDGRLLGGLIAYQQGGHLATAFSADRAELRRELPGTMHLLRWHVIREALGAGYPSIDLGGVDVRGARHKPEKGDPTHGLWEHKASFGAEWVESAPAHEIVVRPWVYRAGLAAGRVRRLVRGRLGRR
ncbi:MAG TPA: GNAT family N-acetyltransferase [Clostridia bacterium]|nr:GNAT family N-acetyltransferase [Clostridia bacterium]